MSVRLSEVGEYSQRVAERRPAEEYIGVPETAPREALTRGNNLRLSERGQSTVAARLGELVQVVT